MPLYVNQNADVIRQMCDLYSLPSDDITRYVVNRKGYFMLDEITGERYYIPPDKIYLGT